MSPFQTRIARRSVAVLAMASTFLLLASPAAASPETLKRSMGNIIFSPFDFALAPIVGTRTIYNNLRDIDDTVGVRVVYVLPGIGWNAGVGFMASIVRMTAGLIELVPGVALFFFRPDLDPIFAPPERGSALIDMDTPALHFKLGVDYMTVPF